MKIVIATPHARFDNLEAALRAQSDLEVMRLHQPEELTYSVLSAYGPRYVFFPHWSEKIPVKIHRAFRCVIFHMTDVPFGRGGSPLQNLIIRGHRDTVLTALQCVDELDAGPVYLKRALSLHGTAEEIFTRAALLMKEMIEIITRDEPQPQPQSGEAVFFRRRTPEDGNLAALETPEQAFDYIRMLDAEGYPRAFIETAHLRFDFSRSSLTPDGVIADVRIRRK